MSFSQAQEIAQGNNFNFSFVLQNIIFTSFLSLAVWPVWAIYWTLGKFLKPLSTINLPKYPRFLGKFCKGVKIYHIFSGIVFGNFYRHLAIFSGHTGPLLN